MTQNIPQQLQKFVQNTVAKQDLTNLRVETFFNYNITQSNLLERCLRSFIFGTIGYETVNQEIFQQCEQEISDFLINVFNVTNDEFNVILNRVKTVLKSRGIKLEIGVIEAKGIENLEQPKVKFVFLPGNSYERFQALDTTQTLQNQSPQASIGFLSNDWSQLRVSDREITVETIIGGKTVNIHKIPYNQITCEGFCDWIEFNYTETDHLYGEETHFKVRLLVKIRFDMTGKENPEYTQIFHWFIIKRFFEYKLSLYRNQSKLFVPHFMTAQNSLNQIIPLKPINCREDLWHTSGRSMSDIPEEIRETQKEKQVMSFLRTEGIIGRKCKLSDFQNGNFFYGFDAHSVCLCNEWCNLEAFMHYNPIIRFILYQHNQLFVHNKTQIPIYYFMVFCNILRDNSAQQQSTPVYNLLESIHTIVVKQINLSLTDPMFQTLFFNSGQKTFTIDIIGSIYNCLRYDIGFALITSSQAIDSFVFSNTVIENIRIYYTVLFNMHNVVIVFDIFLDQINRKDFSKELDDYSQIFYLLFLRESLKIISSNPYRCPLESKLFNIDFTAEGKYGYEQDIESVLEMRKRVNLIEKNPLNVPIYANNSMAFVIKYSLFIAKVLPNIKHKSINDYLFESEYFVDLDTDLNDLYFNPNFKIDFFYVTIDTRNSPINEMYLYLYLTLIFYGIQFSIKAYNIRIMTKNCRIESYPKNFPARDLHFIFTSDWVEYSFSRVFDRRHNANLELHIIDRNLYESGVKNTQKAIQTFYVKFWKKLTHEIQPTPSLLTASESLLIQHKKVYYFQIQNGFRFNIFRNIFIQIDRRINSIQQKSQDILENKVLNVLSNITDFDAKPEVLDVLAFWLCRAEASVLINCVANILKSLHDLEDQTIIARRTHFTLSKPGFVHIFETMDVFLNRINQMKTFYMIYDDECDRMSVVLDQTIISIKNLYQCSYRKFVNDWSLEISKFSFDRTVRTPAEYTVMSNAILLHIMNGYLFYYYIGLSHRYSFRYSQYIIEDILNKLRNHIHLPTSLPHHNDIYDILNVFCIQFKEDINHLRQMTPFLSQPFTQRYGHIFSGFTGMVPHLLDLNIDLANVPID